MFETTSVITETQMMNSRTAPINVPSFHAVLRAGLAGGRL